MNPQVWQEVLKEGERLGLPIKDKRGVLREFLQTKILGYLYEQRGTEKLQFMGGTALRIVYSSPRFSEDLDFDNFSLTANDLKRVIDKVSQRLSRQGIENRIAWRQAGKRAVFIFANILFNLGISGHQAEKLKINFDQHPKRGKIPYQVFFLSRFDINQRIVVNTAQVILAEKIQALLSRKRVIPRDIFDIAWLLSKNFQPERAVLARFGLKQNEELIEKLVYKTKELKGSQLNRELIPFLFGQDSLKLLKYFPHLVEKMGRK